ncbi:hypothetical protein ABT034_34140 [Streptomyces sp. NPDC002773]|uniref:hypothetical protein n=1 Tax=Streptomyces sp. NPDC002773 TaxID=3154430 RepID=UPI00331AEE69
MAPPARRPTPLRRLATLLPAILCAVWSLLVLPAPAAQTLGPMPHPASAPAASAPHHGPPRASSPEPHFAPTAVVRLPAAVENPVRIPGTPAALGTVPPEPHVPARGVLVGDPRRERAPPGTDHGPRAPRGPPSTRHS